MTWEIVVGIIALVGFVVTLGGVIAKLSGTLTKLQTTIETLNEILAELKEQNTNEHREFYERLHTLEDRVLTIECEFK